MELLLKWLSIGNKGYKPMQQTEQPVGTYMSYADHGYADDISITTGTLDNLQIQIKQLNLFSKYKGLELEQHNARPHGHYGDTGTP